MSRVEKYKKIRKINKYYAIIILMFFLILFSGLHAVNNSINMLMGNNTKENLISVKYMNNSIFHLNILNRKIKVNTIYFEKELKRMGIIR